MSTVAIVGLVNTLLGLLEGLVPTIQSLFAAGAISANQQLALKARIDALRDQVATPGPLVNDGKAP
jgi:hypothetical protein